MEQKYVNSKFGEFFLSNYVIFGDVETATTPTFVATVIVLFNLSDIHLLVSTRILWVYYEFKRSYQIL